MILDQFYTLFEVQTLVEDFECLLKKHHIEIQRNSELERLCLNVIDVLEKHLKPNLRKPQEDIRPYFREFMGLHDLISKIVRAKNHHCFTVILPHLRKLNSSNPLQNVGTSVLNTENNKILELYMAILCMNTTEGDIAVDHPDHSFGNNPDVIANIRNKNWGFACKALHSLNAQSIFENIKIAVEQIENSSVDVGIPVLSIKNVINHDEFWPFKGEDHEGVKLFGAFMDVTIPLFKIADFTNKLHCNLASEIGYSAFNGLFDGKKSHPLCLIYCATATSIAKDGNTKPTRLNTFNMLQFSDNISEECIAILKDLNHQLQVT